MTPTRRITYLGPVGTYTHRAALTLFPSPTQELIPAPSIASVFAAVSPSSPSASSPPTLGVVPFENSTYGAVLPTLDLLASLPPTSTLAVLAEVYLPITHCLLTHPANNIASDIPITKVYSHPQALGQCAAYLSTHIPAATRIDTASTAAAAELVARSRPEDGFAALASREAAVENGLFVRAEGVEDVKGNATRFFVIGEVVDDAGETRGGDIAEEKKEDKKYKSLLLFTVPHRQPGALARVLECFRAHGINLTSINSRPMRARPFEYVFFAELEGRVGTEVRREAEGVAAWVRWLGSWEDKIGGLKQEGK